MHQIYKTRGTNFHYRLGRLVAIVLLIILGGSVTIEAPSMFITTQGVKSWLLEGASNQGKTCADLEVCYADSNTTWTEFKLEDATLTNGFHSDGTLEVNITLDSTGGGFDWTSNIGVDAIVVKNGQDGANFYVYDGLTSPLDGTIGTIGTNPVVCPTGTGGTIRDSEELSDENLTTPDDGDKEISHISFCYDVPPPSGDELDFGDAPDPRFSTAGEYPTLLANNGARHILSTGPFLGATVDAEADGQPNATATGDGSDEDGVVFTSLLVTGQTASVDVTASAPGKLNAWIDFNSDGDWADTGEQIFTDVVLAGFNSLVFPVPGTATAGLSFARFRFDQGGGLAPDGLAPDGEVEDYQVEICLQFPFMTMWAVNDHTDGKLQFYTLDVASPFLNIEGDILGITGDKDLEDLIIDVTDGSLGPLNSLCTIVGTIYIVNNVGTSTIYSLDFSEFDGIPATPVTATLVGSTGLPTNPNTASPEEISSLLVHNGTLYGMSKGEKILYVIDKSDGSVTPECTLSVAGEFRTDGMTFRPDDETVYLLKTNDSGGESEIWKFIGFPSDSIEYVLTITSSGKVEALSAHPDGFLYASDLTTLYKISVPPATPFIGFLAEYTVDIEGMDFFFEIEELIPVVPTRQFIPIAPTPVELVSFTAEAKSGKIMLSWQTATEVNNYGFEIHRRVYPAVGGTQSDEWVTLGFVDGHGNSNSPKTYSFADNNPAGGSKFSYRLKQIDNDGTYEYSDIVEVEFVPTEFALFQNYPNPFNPTTKIKYSIPQESIVTIKVYDILGEEVATLLNEKQEAGTYDVDFDGRNLGSGIYLYKMEAETFSQIKKMLIIK